MNPRADPIPGPRGAAAPTASHRRAGVPLLRCVLAAALLAACSGLPGPRQPAAPGGSADERAEQFARQIVAKRRTDAVFAAVLGAEMTVRKVSYPGADGLEIPAYLFVPPGAATRRPAIVFVHGGIHADFGLVHLEQVRSLVREGYVIVAPEYRGSTGYGERFHDAIDYGGKEVDDVVAARDYLARRVPSADLDRLAVMGYSHGGYIALLAVLRHPEWFRAAVAHVPVADLPTRMRTHPGWYQDLFAAQPAFGARLEQNPAPYIERSPSTHARKLQVPVLVHTADNDDDVFIAENHVLRDSMVAAGKDTAGLYTYREWHNPPGGHSFGALDTPQGRESWRETLDFLARHLEPRGRRSAPREPDPFARCGAKACAGPFAATPRAGR